MKVVVKFVFNVAKFPFVKIFSLIKNIFNPFEKIPVAKK